MKKKITSGGLTRIVLFGVAATLLGLAPPADAVDYYTWPDQEGITHFSETAPENGDARRVHADVAVPASRSADPNAESHLGLADWACGR